VKWNSAVKPLEHVEQAVGVGRLEPRAVVTDRDEHLALHAVRGDLDLRVRDPAGELQRVADEVDEHLSEEREVGSDRR
jgi:hypothetical protein